MGDVDNKTCGSGHALTPDNVYYFAKKPGKPKRMECKKCRSEKARIMNDKSRQKLKELKAARDRSAGIE